MEKVDHIPDDEYVLRRIYPTYHNDGQMDTPAFSGGTDERPSVHWEKLIDMKLIMKSFPGFDFFLKLRVGDLRTQGHDVIHEPDEDSGDISHCVIVPSEGKWTRSKKLGLVGRGINPIFGERVDLP